MAQSDDRKKYVTLDDIRVSYKPKDDTIHLTSTDPDVQAGGFHLSLSKGTQTETTLRDLLIEHEVIKNILPKFEFNETTPKLDLTKKGSVLTVSSNKGGVGKTTLSLLVGSLLNDALIELKSPQVNQKDLRVCVVDMDTRDGQIGYLLEKSTPTVVNLLTASELTPEVIKSNLHYDEKLGIWVLLAPKRARTADYLSPELYQDIIQKLRGMFDVVVLDTLVNYISDPLLNEVAFPLSDVILLLTNYSRGKDDRMNRWINEMEQTNPEVLAKTINVANMIMEGMKLTPVSTSFGEVPLVGILPLNGMVHKAYAENNLRSLLEKSDEFSKNLKRIVKNITSI
jgi:MinD-like ATPase involved in chromosome partitioning or flagellar assembly